MLQKLIVACLILTAVPVAAQNITVSQSIDQSQMAFEDTAHFQVTLSWPGPQSAYLFPKPIMPEFEKFQVGKFSSSVTSTGQGAEEVTTRTLRWNLIPVNAGQAILEPLTIEYITWPDSTAGRVSTEAISVTIAEPKPRMVDEGGGISAVGFAVIGVVLLAIVGGVMYFMMRGRPAPQPLRPPEDVFLDELEKLKTDTGSDLKRFQTGLYKQLVAYLNSRYNLELGNKSADEIAGELEDIDMNAAHREKIVGWLQRAERERFSPIASAPGESMRIEAEVRELFGKMK